MTTTSRVEFAPHLVEALQATSFEIHEMADAANEKVAFCSTSSTSTASTSSCA